MLNDFEYTHIHFYKANIGSIPDVLPLKGLNFLANLYKDKDSDPYSKLHLLHGKTFDSLSVAGVLRRNGAHEMILDFLETLPMLSSKKVVQSTPPSWHV